MYYVEIVDPNRGYSIVGPFDSSRAAVKYCFLVPDEYDAYVIDQTKMEEKILKTDVVSIFSPERVW